MLKTQNFGRKSLNEIKDILSEMVRKEQKEIQYGITLAGPHRDSFSIMLGSNVPANTLLTVMKSDKKVINDQHRLILMKGLGGAFIAEGVKDSEILAAIQSCLPA